MVLVVAGATANSQSRILGFLGDSIWSLCRIAHYQVDPAAVDQCNICFRYGVLNDRCSDNVHNKYWMYRGKSPKSLTVLAHNTSTDPFKRLTAASRKRPPRYRHNYPTYGEPDVVRGGEVEWRTKGKEWKTVTAGAAIGALTGAAVAAAFFKQNQENTGSNGCVVIGIGLGAVTGALIGKIVCVSSDGVGVRVPIERPPYPDNNKPFYGPTFH